MRSPMSYWRSEEADNISCSDDGDPTANTEKFELLGPPKSKLNHCSRRRVILIITAMLFLLLLFVLFSFFGNARASTGKKNVILMISDGMGPASLTLARSYQQYIKKLPIGHDLLIDPFLVGSSRTRSSDSLVTDSAAGATAFSCAMKSYNGAIAIDPEKLACGTLLEAAKKLGYMTGLVVTSRITHATPASFNSHVVHRDLEDDIAYQQVGGLPLQRTTDLMFGGGLCHFLPQNSNGSCRLDDIDVIAKAKENEFSLITSLSEFEALKDGLEVKFPLLGLFASDHMSFEIDRNVTEQPSLLDMSSTALNALLKATEDSEQGLFLMIEGSRIDMASHNNDPVSHVRDVLMYDQVFSLAQNFINKNGGVLLSTSDHETGGLSVARQVTETYPEYLWHPEGGQISNSLLNNVVLANATFSTELLGLQILSFPNDQDIQSFIANNIIKKSLGILDATEDEINAVVKVRNNSLSSTYLLSDIVSRRAQLGWSTHGHSAVDVNVYAYSPTEKLPQGNMENTYIGKYIVDYLGLDLPSITKELNKEGNSFFQTSFDFSTVRNDHNHDFTNLESYHGIH
ncbi:Repressible alkaline phosphatase [Neolecta irregularis DAH-3]|uniref:Alkaline phosphatase n=1 Tax=Neolecta irregularis (strain DAH-3) TaxID=1198029 RepID=A0A1U7LRL8_NEOID|nr:Repressible alkaline phosphatase [Neolecta irregularis DAH-3]|eukprot:OLL25268.1 Repressible alkaline phosphatase [Neolecta irregularis DAH-3]